MKKGYVYSLICPISNEIRYIGLTTTTLTKRYNKHIKDIDKSSSYKNNWLKNIRRLGKLDLLKIELIEECDINILNNREIYWISFYKEKGLKLTNTTLGGNVGSKGYKHTEEAKQKISECSKGPRKEMSKIGKNNISKSLKGNKRRLGKKHTEATKKKISASKKGIITWNKKPVYQYDKDLNFIKKWPSAKDVEKELGFSAGNISSVCNGKRLSANKYKWYYERLEEIS